ncbi:hypothetical protein [Bartonella taylorii]|uniref:hypothetical protein n=1 Tax=Bartonella taylorii TaxID=33046 RepID=UPI001FEF4A17|nr:hypothetical protein [Bartonella taylorii]
MKNSFLTKINLVRKAVLNTGEKAMKDKAAEKHSNPLMVVQKKYLEKKFKRSWGNSGSMHLRQ